MAPEANDVQEVVTVDFDHHDPAFSERRREEWAELRRCPVAFNTRYGGYWVVSGYDEVAQVARDDDVFSSHYSAEPHDGVDYHGILGIPRPPGFPPAGIAETTPEVHRLLRRSLNPYLVPGAIARLRPFMEALTTWFIDEQIESGHCDVVNDITSPVPALVTLRLVGLPLSNWRRYSALFHGTVSYPVGSPPHDAAVAQVPDMIAELLAEAEQRRLEPRDDLLSALVALRKPDGEPLEDEELASVLWNLVGGGLDTTTSLTALTLYHLDTHPDLRSQLQTDPAVLNAATEEYLRYTSVNEMLSRTVVADVELGGRQLRKGDRVMISWLAANLDDKQFPDPDQVRFDRGTNPHLAFGVGPHRCIGMHLARTQFQVLLTDILRRLPDLKIDRSATKFYEGNSELAGVVSMPATFTPGRRTGIARPF